MDENRVIYKTSWIDLILGSIGFIVLSFFTFLFFFGGYWWLALPAIGFIIYLLRKTAFVTLRENGLSRRYLYKNEEYRLEDIERVEIEYVRLSNVQTHVLAIHLKDGTNVFIEFDGLWNCCEFLNFFRSKNVPVVKGKNWIDKIFLSPEGRYQVKSN